MFLDGVQASMPEEDTRKYVENPILIRASWIALCVDALQPGSIDGLPIAKRLDMVTPSALLRNRRYAFPV